MTTTIDVTGPLADRRNQSESAECGNLRAKYGAIELAALAQTAVAAIVRVPAYATLIGCHWGHDALGANTSLSFGYETQDAASAAAAAIKADAATTAAGAGYAAFEGIETGASGLIITVTQGGAGTATGTVWVAPVFVYHGY